MIKKTVDGRQSVFLSKLRRFNLKENGTRHGRGTHEVFSRLAFFPTRPPPYRPSAFTMAKCSSERPLERKPAASRLRKQEQ